MKRRILLCTFLLIALSASLAFPAYASNSDVTLVVESDSGSGSGGSGDGGSDSGGGSGDSGDGGSDSGSGSGGSGDGGSDSGSGSGGSGGGSSGGGSSGGGSSSGGSGGSSGSGGSTGESNKPGEPAGGKDGFGNDYYLKPEVSVDDSVRKHGYIIGKNDWVFDPNGNLTRAEFATILDRVFVFKDETITKRFEDTKGHWAEDAICRLASNGVIQGVSSREFKPEGTLRRDEALLMLSRVLYTDKYNNKTDLVDVKGHYAEETLSNMINSGVYSKLDKNFDIRSTISRDEMIHIVNNIIYSRIKSEDSLERYLKENAVFTDLLSNKADVYYMDCLKAIDKSFLNNKLGGLF